jgi:hypothetical protein
MSPTYISTVPPTTSLTLTTPVVRITVWPTPYSTPEQNPTQIAARLDVFSGTNAGTVIAHGTNVTPIVDGPPLITYEVREVTLPISVTYEHLFPDKTGEHLVPQLVTFDKIWVFTVTGGPFVAANNAWTIWLDDTIVGESGGGDNGIAVLIVDPVLLREGARIGVSWGRGKPEESYLPERLHFERPPVP